MLQELRIYNILIKKKEIRTSLWVEVWDISYLLSAAMPFVSTLPVDSNSTVDKTLAQ